eukprot:scaffold4562_cov183-Ochromonas_danica.AAC.4
MVNNYNDNNERKVVVEGGGGGGVVVVEERGRLKGILYLLSALSLLLLLPYIIYFSYSYRLSHKKHHRHVEEDKDLNKLIKILEIDQQDEPWNVEEKKRLRTKSKPQGGGKKKEKKKKKKKKGSRVSDGSGSGSVSIGPIDDDDDDEITSTSTTLAVESGYYPYPYPYFNLSLFFSQTVSRQEEAVDHLLGDLDTFQRNMMFLTVQAQEACMNHRNYLNHPYLCPYSSSSSSATNTNTSSSESSGGRGGGRWRRGKKIFYNSKPHQTEASTLLASILYRELCLNQGMNCYLPSATTTKKTKSSSDAGSVRGGAGSGSGGSLGSQVLPTPYDSWLLSHNDLSSQDLLTSTGNSSGNSVSVSGTSYIHVTTTSHPSQRFATAWEQRVYATTATSNSNSIDKQQQEQVHNMKKEVNVKDWLTTLQSHAIPYCNNHSTTISSDNDNNNNNVSSFYQEWYNSKWGGLEALSQEMTGFSVFHPSFHGIFWNGLVKKIASYEIFVLVTERFDESMILLRWVMEWPMDDSSWTKAMAMTTTTNHSSSSLGNATITTAAASFNKFFSEGHHGAPPIASRFSHVHLSGGALPNNNNNNDQKKTTTTTNKLQQQGLPATTTTTSTTVSEEKEEEDNKMTMMMTMKKFRDENMWYLPLKVKQTTSTSTDTTTSSFSFLSLTQAYQPHDFFINLLANRVLDRLIVYYGKARFQRDLQRYRQNLKEVQSICMKEELSSYSYNKEEGGCSYKASAVSPRKTTTSTTIDTATTANTVTVTDTVKETGRVRLSVADIETVKEKVSAAAGRGAGRGNKHHQDDHSDHDQNSDGDYVGQTEKKSHHSQKMTAEKLKNKKTKTASATSASSSSSSSNSTSASTSTSPFCVRTFRQALKHLPPDRFMCWLLRQDGHDLVHLYGQFLTTTTTTSSSSSSSSLPSAHF